MSSVVQNGTRRGPSAINVQFHGEAWLVTYGPANAESDQPVVVREISSREDADSRRRFGTLVRRRADATIDPPTSTALQTAMFPHRQALPGGNRASA
jgi:hypothetical protein